MKTILITILFANLISAQTNQEEHHELAKYFILRNCVEDYGRFIFFNDSSQSEYNLEQIKDIVEKDSFNYKIENVFQFRNYKTIQIFDKTNLHPHGLYNSFFIFDTTTSYSNYSEVSQNSILQFINSRLAQDLSDGERDKIIDLYNLIYYYPLESLTYKIEFYGSINYDSFTDLEYVIKFSELFGFHKNWDNSLYQRRVYKKHTENKFIEYYEVIYTFDCNKLRIDEKLLLKEKMVESK